MGFTDFFRRLFTPAPTAEGAEDEAIQRKEYGTGEPEEPRSDFVVGGPAGQGGFQGLGSAEAAEDAIHATDPPDDPAP